MTAYSSEQAFRKELIENDDLVDALSDGQRCETHDADPATTAVQGGGADDATEAPPDSGAGPGNPPPRAIPTDDAFHVLQNARRRAVLRYILDHPEEGQFSMPDLAEEIAAWEHDTTVRDLSSDQRQRVYIALYQSHLPNLDDYGVITYDQSRGVVEPTPLLAAFASFLEAGLHADTQSLTLDDGAGTPTETGPGGRSGLVASLSSLFTR